MYACIHVCACVSMRFCIGVCVCECVGVRRQIYRRASVLSDDVGPGHESAQPVMDSDGPQERKSSAGEAGDEDGEAEEGGGLGEEEQAEVSGSGGCSEGSEQSGEGRDAAASCSCGPIR